MAFTFIRGFSLLHSGIDLSAPRGAPVHAVNGGTVRFAGPATAPTAPSFTRGGGNVVVVRVGGRDELYAHLDGVRAYTNQTIPRGGLIGTVGATGNASGPHLHYAWWQSGRAIAPAIAVDQLIAAVSGRAPAAGGATLVEIGSDEHATEILRILETYIRPAIGRLTWVEAVKPTGSLDFWNIGNPNNSGVSGLMVRLDYIQPPISRNAIIARADYDRMVALVRQGTEKALGSDPLGLGAFATGVVEGLAGIVKSAGQVGILAALALLGVYLLTR